MQDKIIRREYLDKLVNYKDNGYIKFITGVRNVGKTKLIESMIAYLLANDVANSQIINLNFDLYQYKALSAEEIYDYIKDNCIDGRRMYIFLDEVSRIRYLEEKIESLRKEVDVDIYISSSISLKNYYDCLKDRYLEINVLPLTFKEFVNFNNYNLKTVEDLSGNNKIEILDSDNKRMVKKQLFNTYLRFGAMPFIKETNFDKEEVLVNLDDSFEMIVSKGILQKDNQKRLARIFHLISC